MKNKLSHSQINKFLFCGEAYRLHYKEGYRTNEVNAYFLFGTAIGRAFEYALNPESSEVENVANAKGMFDYYWSYQDINGVLTNIKDCKEIVYSKSDIDYDLITSEHQNDNPAWHSLRAKAHLMIDTFEKEFKPMVEHTFSTEEETHLENDEGDVSIGYADAVVKLKEYNKPVVLDFKTASRPYSDSSVQYSVQLSQYLHSLSSKYENTRYAGYVVFLKNIVKNRVKICSSCGFDGTGAKHKTCNNEVNGKRCNSDWKETLSPKAEMQIVIDEIPESNEHFIIDNIDNVNRALKTGIYTKNVNGCFDNGFGRPCEFQKLCWNNDQTNLTKLSK
jgi:hypothetical protein